jgi:hypothetical protein
MKKPRLVRYVHPAQKPIKTRCKEVAIHKEAQDREVAASAKK